jgi:hypothetical protein
MRRLFAAVLMLCGTAMAADRFIVVPEADVKVLEGPANRLGEMPGSEQHRIVMADGAEAYILNPWTMQDAEARERPVTRPVIRTPSDHAPTGTQYTTAEPIRFQVDAAASADAKDLFYIARMDYYRTLQFRGGAGAAWFRFQADQSRGQISPEKLKAVSNRWEWMGSRESRPKLDLFTGGRAVSREAASMTRKAIIRI